MCSKKNNVVWHEHREEREKSFVGFVQIFTYETIMMLKSSELVVYPVHSVLQSFSNGLRESLIWNGLTLTGFLSVCCSGSSKGEGQKEGRTDRISVYGF